ncbi:MAG: TolC family protein [Chitinophagaceae bacterium]
MRVSKLRIVLGIAFSMQVILAAAQKNTLDYFLDQALDNSPLLKDFQNQQLSLSLDSQLIGAALKPQVNGNSTNLYAPIINGYGYDEAITNGQQLSALVVVSKSFLSNKAVAAQVANLQLQSLITRNNGKITEQDLKKAIIDQYIVVYGEQLELDYNSHINELLKREDSILKKLTQDNVYKQTDYLSFTVTRQQQLLTTSQLQVQHTFDYSGLNYLAGILDTTVQLLADPHLELRANPDFSSSVFNRQFVLDSLKLINDKALLDLNYRPKIDAFADAGYNSSLAYLPYKNFGTSIGINLSIPIYDGRQRRLQYSKLAIQERTRVNKRDFFIRQHDQQVMQLLQQLRATENFIEQIDKQITYTETLITVNERLLATGDIRLTDFILALNNYFTARNMVTQNYVSRLKIVNQINYWTK